MLPATVCTGCQNDVQRYDRKWIDERTGQRRCAWCAEAANGAGKGTRKGSGAASSIEAAAVVLVHVGGAGTAAIQNEVTDIQSQVTVMQQQMRDVQAQIALRQQVPQIQAQATRMEQQISAVQAQVAEANNWIMRTLTDWVWN